MSADKPIFRFIDTNILVYAYDTSAGRKREIALELVRHCWENQQGCLSLQVLQELYVSLTRKIVKSLDIETARQVITEFSYWRVHNPEVKDILEAIDIQKEHQIHFWDAMIIQSALGCGCKQIYSEDLNHGQSYRGIKVLNPFIE